MDEALRRNRELWDAWTKIHVGSTFYDVASFRSGERSIRVADYEREEVGSVEGRTLLHLQCHFGLDTLSWARLGATVTGADFSGEAIGAARVLAAEVGLAATFVMSDLYRLPDVLEEQFDIVYTSSGVLGWLPDIASWGRVAAHFVRPGGFLYVTEIHPVAQVFENEGVEPGELRLAYPYWSHPEPLRFEVKGSYADPEAPTDGLVEYGWDHSLGEILTSLADAASGSSSSTSSILSGGRWTSSSRARTDAGASPMARRGASRSSSRSRRQSLFSTAPDQRDHRP